MSGYGDDLIEAPWPKGRSRRGDPVSPEADAFHRELSRWHHRFLQRHELLVLDDATAEQDAEYVAGVNEICARYGVPPLP